MFETDWKVSNSGCNPRSLLTARTLLGQLSAEQVEGLVRVWREDFILFGYKLFPYINKQTVKMLI